MNTKCFVFHMLNTFPLLQEVEPGVREPTPCRRAAFHLTLSDPSARGTVATGGSRTILSVYILFFCLGVLFSACVMFVINRRRSGGRQGNHLPDNSLSSEKGRDLLGSSDTPQSPSSASLLSDGFRLTEKRNGTATSNTTTTLVSNHGNGSHCGNSYSSNLLHCNPSNGHGNNLHGNCNTNSSGMMFDSEILDAEMLNGRTGERGRQSGVGEEVDAGLRDGLGGGAIEDEIAKMMFKPAAPLAPCEESSI